MDAVGGDTFLTEPQFNYDDLVDDDQGNLEILISGVTETSQSTLLLKKKKEMREVDDALEFMKEEYRKRMDLCAKRQKKFEEKQAEMKSMVARFQQFIQDNDAKRNRAEVKAMTEAQTCARLDKDAAVHRRRLQQLQEERAELESRLGRLSRYSEYLERIVMASEGEYDEIPDLLMRFKTLKQANADLHAQSQSNSKKVAVLRAELATLRSKGQNLALVMSSESQQHVKRIEQLSAESAVLDVSAEHSADAVRSREAETGQVVNAIQYLYHRCWSSMRTQPKLLVNKSKTAAASIAFLNSCLELVAIRMENLSDIAEGYPSWVEAKAREARAKASRDAHGAGAGAGVGAGPAVGTGFGGAYDSVSGATASVAASARGGSSVASTT